MLRNVVGDFINHHHRRRRLWLGDKLEFNFKLFAFSGRSTFLGFESQILALHKFESLARLLVIVSRDFPQTFAFFAFNLKVLLGKNFHHNLRTK
jgi:hypothetical protein